MMNTPDKQTSGVQELIDRIREEGVARGQSEADALLEKAREEADRMLGQAREEAEALRAAARADVEDCRRQGQDALRLAARDAQLALDEAIRDDFASKVRHLVSRTMHDRTFLERLILEIARKSMSEVPEQPTEVLLPEALVRAEELAKNREELADDRLARFVLELGGDVLREGLSFVPAGDDRAGIRVRLVEDEVEIDLSDETVADLLMAHLLPRFRALVEAPTV